MLTQTENKVRIEGILSEIDLAPRTFKKNGVEVNAVGGSIKVRVPQSANGSDCEVPVHMFAPEFTNSGSPNPAYESISKVMKEFSSIAAVGLDSADRIRITGATITMNEYYGQNGNLVSFPRITASFVTKIRKDDCKPSATFDTVFVIGSMGYETDKDGVETDRFKISAILPQYGGKVDIVPFYASTKSVADSIQNYWNVGDTVKAHGRLNFSSKTEVVSKELGFGESSEQTRTISVSELLITAGVPEPMSGEFALDADEVTAALADRKARLAALKDKGAAKVQPVSKTAIGNKFKDYGF